MHLAQPDHATPHRAVARVGERDQRGVRLHVRAHHDDVPQLEGRVVGEEAEQHLAEYLDLSVPAVARMHPDAGVVAAERVRAGWADGAYFPADSTVTVLKRESPPDLPFIPEARTFRAS